jgi:hypothetical protein
MTTQAMKKHMDKVASLPCITCGAEPVEVHHIREGQGMAQRASNWLVVPLCPSCHRGSKGIHGDKSMMNLRKWTELDLLAITLERLFQ